jgi:PAS domain S-box-containing protein
MCARGPESQLRNLASLAAVLPASEADEKFAVLCKAGFDGVLVHDGGTVVEANDKCASMFGCSVAEIVGRNFLDLTAPEMHRLMREHSVAGTDHPFDSVAVRANGDRFPIELCEIPVENSSLRVVAIRDLSERRLREQIRRKREKRHRVLAQVAFDGICVQKDGKLLEVNQAFARMTGYSAKELIGTSVELLVSADERAKVLERIRRRDCSNYESMMLRKDGTTLAVEVCGTTVEDGERVTAIRDISKRREADAEREESLAAIRHSEEHFRSIIENASDLIAIIAPDGTLTYQSPSIERVLGITVASVVGRTFLNLVHSDDAQKTTKFLEAQIAEPAAEGRIELRLHHRNGSWRSFEVVARNLTSGGAVTAIVINKRDITDRKMLEAQLAQANRLSSLGRLAATVAHEFNNVLMGIQPFTELIQRPNASPAVISKGAWHIANSIQRGKRITLDILRFTQPAQPVTAQVDIGEWWEKFAPEAETVVGNVIRLVAKIQTRGTCVVADKEQLSQVMANLVSNARDAMPGGGTLTIEAVNPAPDSVFAFGVVTNPEQFIQISVSDTGQGIAPEVIQQIFEPLFTTKKSGGTGLGLAVAHQVLTQHGGFIFAESEVGRGATFHLFIPIGTAPCDEECVTPGTFQNPAGHTLLMIEDELPIVEGITALLSAEGMNVVAVGSGEEAAGAVERYHPDVVLLDFGLPDMDGADVYEVLRKANPLLPVIFATGHGDRRAIHDDMSDHRTRFLQKPFEIAALLELIAELLPAGEAR